MPREVTIVTPENIPLDITLAGLSTRFGALLIDSLIQTLGILFLIIAAIGMRTALGGTLDGVASAMSGWVVAGFVIALFLILFGYYIFFETIWNGQTPGKRVFGLRVIRDGGYPVNVFSVVTRNLVRIVDTLPGNYAIGAVSVFFHPQYKRLGDMAAGTLVVRERNRAAAVTAVPAVDKVYALPAGVRHPSDVLTSEELGLLRRFAVRRWDMLPDDAERMAYRIVAPLVGRLGIAFTPGVPPRYAELITMLVAAADARDEESLR